MQPERQKLRVSIRHLLAREGKREKENIRWCVSWKFVFGEAKSRTIASSTRTTSGKDWSWCSGSSVVRRFSVTQLSCVQAVTWMVSANSFTIDNLILTCKSHHSCPGIGILGQPKGMVMVINRWIVGLPWGELKVATCDVCQGARACRDPRDHLNCLDRNCLSWSLGRQQVDNFKNNSSKGHFSWWKCNSHTRGPPMRW